MNTCEQQQPVESKTEDKAPSSNDRENHSVIKHYIRMSMNQMRHLQVDRIIQQHKIRSFIDLGCSQGQLLQKLGRNSDIDLIVGVDMDEDAVLKTVFNTLPEHIQQSVQFQRQCDQHIYIYKGNATKKYPTLKDKNVQLVTMVELIEHLIPEDIPATLDNVFGYLQPEMCFISTPNKEFNDFFAFTEGQMRHWDHKFEWTRNEFLAFCEGVKHKYGYYYRLGGIGEHVSDGSKGYCTQYALFSRPNVIANTSISDEVIGEIEERAHYTNLCWKSNMDKITVEALYKSLSYRENISFEQGMEAIRRDYIGVCLQNEGIKIDRDLIMDYLEKNNDIFEWDNNIYQIKKRESEMQVESSVYREQMDFEACWYSQNADEPQKLVGQFECSYPAE